MISEFKGESRFLSNFFAVPIMYEGVEYPSVEHAFQAAKSLDPEERIKINPGTLPIYSSPLPPFIKLMDNNVFSCLNSHIPLMDT